MPLDLTSFAIKWQQTELSEKSAYQQHFRDLCEALGVPHPTEEDVKAIADAARELVRLRDAWLNPEGASEADLKDRTLTKLYNARPEWLANAARTLDEAVFAAYGWPAGLPDQEILSRLLALNHERATTQPKS